MSLYSSLTQVLAPFAAKIKGIQTGYDGTEYNSPGEAVRGQINDLHVLIGDVPGTAIQASAVAYNDSNVAAELTNVNGRLQRQQGIIAEAFSAQSTYDVGDSVIYEAGLYTFKADKSAGAWDATKVDGPFKVTEQISNLKEDLFDIVGSMYADGDAVTLQVNTAESFGLYNPLGHIHVKSTNASIYTGTVNNIDLVGLAQGTFVDANSGVTIEISGSEIYIHGTTTAGFRFNPQTGEFYTDGFTNHLADYSRFPNNKCRYAYCWWEKEGYTAPTNVYFAIRHDGTGNVSAVNLSGHSNPFWMNGNYDQYVSIYTNGAITGLDVKITLGLKINALTALEGGSIEQVAKATYGTTVITTAGYYGLGAFTWTGANTVYDVVSTIALLQPNPLTNGHVYAWFGDSISQLKELPNLVADLLNVTVHDCTFAGAPLTYGDPVKYQPTGFMSLCSQIVAGDFSDLSDAIDAQEAAGTNVTEKRMHLATLQSLDFNNVTDIVVFAGTNDFDNDYVNATKFINGFSSALETLLTEYPHLMVYVFSPIWRGDKTEGVVTIPTMPDLVNLEKQVADAFCLPFYDLYHRSGINSLTASVYLQSDVLHPSDAGDALLANKCAKFLQSN